MVSTSSLETGIIPTKEAVTMRNHWLRGILLGVILALLLASGVALAPTLTLAMDKDCVQCWPGPYDEDPPDEYVINLTLDGWDPAHLVCSRVYFNGEPMGNHPNCGAPPHADPPLSGPFFAVPCDPIARPDRRLVVVMDLGGEVFPKGIEALYGEWKLRMWQPETDNADSVTWTLAEVCEVEEEFVPEPATMALLGSGLASLAGYATLRWRSRN